MPSYYDGFNGQAPKTPTKEYRYKWVHATNRVIDDDGPN